MEPACCATQDPAAAGPASEWVTIHEQVADRPALPRAFPMVDADGAALAEVPFTNRPAAIVFFYTRCTNPNKCPLLMRRFTLLRARIEQLGLAEQIDTIAISYDAYRDHPEDLSRYRTALGPQAQGIRMLVPAPDTANAFFTAWSVRAQTSREGVAAHTNELLLVDREGRLQQRNIVLLWDTDQVVQALRHLVTEP
jgi:cytochrome oxidase Cu insertion factor (SCO1/SenC/PrrC family)